MKYAFKQGELSSEAFDLLQEDNFEAASISLEEEIRNSPTDERYRALAICYLEREKLQEALLLLNSIPKPTLNHLWLRMSCYWQLNQWDEMTLTIKELLKQGAHPKIYYYLAIAEKRGRYDFQLDVATLETVKGFLSKAIDVEDALVDAFLWLARLLDENDTDQELQVLRKAIGQYPDDRNIRTELARTYLKRMQFREGLEILEQRPRTAWANQECWLAFQTREMLGHYDEASQLLKEMNFTDETQRKYIEANLLIKQKKMGNWLTALEELADDSQESRISRLLRKAVVNLALNTTTAGIEFFREASDLLFEFDGYWDNQLVVDLQDFTAMYEMFDPLLECCEHLLLLNGEADSVNDEIMGRVLIALYRFYPASVQNELIALTSISHDSMLQTAAQLLNNHPAIGNDLCVSLLQVDLVAAIEHHIRYCIWAHSKGLDYQIELPIEQNQTGTALDLTEQVNRHRGEIANVITDLMDKCQSDDIVRGVFLQFYDDFARDMLFAGSLYETVVQINQRFVSASNGEEGLFDLAFALGQVGDQESAALTYQVLLEREPSNAAAMNNLGVFYDRKGDLPAAQEMFRKAKELAPSSELYASNFKNVSSKLQYRRQCQQREEADLAKLRQKAFDLGISVEQHIEISNLYWNTDISVKALQVQFPVANLYSVLIPLETSAHCPNCGAQLRFKNRSARQSQQSECFGCGHQDRGWCRCDYCLRRQQEAQRLAEEARKQSALEEFRRTQEKYSNPNHVTWALSKLTRKDKEFLRAFLDSVSANGSLDWADVCNRAGVVSEQTYRKKLENIKLLFISPAGTIVANSAIQLEMLDVPNVRRITKGLRFNVLQRDEHTCQYCGRTPPDVVLVIDHLVPVNKGGTDDFDNLITSCEDCNSGKSDKLIELFTGGYTRDEWRETLRQKRIQVLEERRHGLDEVIQQWAEALGKRSISESDRQAVLQFIELYDPDWIKAAIAISAKKGIVDYVKYTAAILRNWAQDGPPDYIDDPDASLSSRKATDKQLAYISSLSFTPRSGEKVCPEGIAVQIGQG